jgi:2-amino-4,5-dihydroxy-6-oxo-7-(phosphonooxy)heptanoate synthase
MREKSGKALRLSRLLNPDGSALFVVPLDHTVSDGPFTDNQGYSALLEALAANGADAIVVHKGRLRQIPERVYAKLSVIVHISASTKYAADVNYKYQVADVEDCLRRGADAISVHVNVGSSTEDKQIATLASAADACDRLGVPLLAMLYPRGDGIKAHRYPEVLAHTASLAVDLGADIVKLPLGGTVGEVRDVVRGCPIPVLAAGGSRTSDEEFSAFVANVVRGGARGIAAGRNIFMAPDPAAKVREIREVLTANQMATVTDILPIRRVREPAIEHVLS